MKEENKINSKKYWDDRFASGSWEAWSGSEQTSFFYNVLLEAIPDWLKNEILYGGLSILDAGCAQGEGTSLISRTFFNSEVTGCDLSEEAINKAKEKYPEEISFIVSSIQEITGKYDCVICSNTIEHMRNPMRGITKLLESSEKYCMIMVPFEEDLSDLPFTKEHEAYFHLDFFPLQIENFHLIYHRIIDTADMADSYWSGYQLLVVYAEEKMVEKLHLDNTDYLGKQENEIRQQIKQLDKEKASLDEKIKEKENNLQLTQDEKQRLISNLEQVQQEKQSIQSNLEQVQQEKQSIQSNLEQVQQEKQSIQSNLEQVQQEKQSIQSNLKQVQDDKQRVQSDLDQALWDKQNLQSNWDHVWQEKQNFYKMIAETKDQVSKLQEKENSQKYDLFLCANSKPYQAANLFVRIKHGIIGNKQDRKEFFHWLKHREDYHDSKYSYLGRIIDKNTEQIEMAQMINNRMEVLSNMKIIQPILLPDPKIKFSEELDEIIKNFSGKYVLYFPPHITDWNLELFQRPQQIALAMGKLNALYLFGTCNRLDLIHHMTQVSANCWLFTEDFLLLAAEIAHKYGKYFVLDLYSTDNSIDYSYVEKGINCADEVIYEYIDEISDIITGKVPQFAHDKHELILQNKQIKIVATAEKLYKEVISKRKSSENCILSGNGVDYQHFHNPKEIILPDAIQNILEKNKPVVGYFGALANWFDYKLLYKAASELQQVEFILIGPPIYSTIDGAHDNVGKDKLSELPNVSFVGTVNYKILPSVAKYFTVATIPFKINEITNSTSPIKLFEYFAMGKPVVTTDMFECRKFPVLISKNSREYIENIKKAIKLSSDKEYCEKLKECSRKHSWISKASDMLNLIDARNYSQLNLLYFSIIDWNFRFQRPQQISKELSSSGFRVFYINSDFGESNKEEKWNQINICYLKKSDDNNCAVYSIKGAGDAQFLIQQIENLISKYHIESATMIVNYPTWLPVVKVLKEKYKFNLVFDYLDEFDGFTSTNGNSFISPSTMWLKRNSDIVIASSQYLYEKIGPTNAQKYLVRNGTETAHFASVPALQSAAASGRKPIIGYYGAIADWFDQDLVIKTAKNLPNYEFLLVGAHDMVDTTELESLPNVTMTGEIPYENLPSYVARMDVCIIPFNASLDLIKATNPVKFYEYLSAGKKIVTTEIPELFEYRNEYVLMTNDPAVFAEDIKACVENTDGLKPEGDRRELASKNDWKIRAEEVHDGIVKLYPKISVIILAWNNSNYTTACIESVFLKTGYPNLEVIAVDNNSTDDTWERLQAMKTRFPLLKIIHNSENLGFAGGNNVAIRQASGDYIVLLNNDTLVTYGWAGRMLQYFKDPDQLIGMVGPVTNEISNEAKIPVNYSNINEIDVFAAQQAAVHCGEFFDIKVLAMFCTMIPRWLINKIGLLDEDYKIGMFEDDDYSLRVQKAGYRTVCTREVFIHHFGRGAFKLLGDKSYNEVFVANRAIYEKKNNCKWEKHHS